MESRTNQTEIHHSKLNGKKMYVPFAAWFHLVHMLIYHFDIGLKNKLHKIELTVSKSIFYFFFKTSFLYSL